MSETTTNKQMSAKNVILEMVKATDITMNGSRPWDIKVHNEKFYSRVLHEGALGLGESYMDGWWDADRLDILFHKILRAGLSDKVDVPWSFKFKMLFANIFNLQTKDRATHVAKKHYDIGNSLFKAMLDSRLMYSCGYWKDAKTLDEAQVAKLDLICKKLHLKPGQRLLDIGCGWGGLAKFAAENYGVSVVGVTISEQQHALAVEVCKGLPIDIRLQDYRDINEQFDRVVSVGMFEHVGHLNYHTFMQTVHRALHQDGIFLLHTIGSTEAAPLANEWITKYIFPNGTVPSVTQMADAAEKFFVMEDWHNFGAYYDNTLMAWHENFVRHWPQLKDQYDDRFYRMWTYYLLACAGSFRARANQLWQIVFTKNGLEGGYPSLR